LTALGGGCRSSRHQRAASGLALKARTQFGDCVPNAQAMACARHTDILQQLVVNLTEQINVKIVGLKGGIQPFADLTHVASCSSNAFASFRSRVPNPSVKPAYLRHARWRRKPNSPRLIALVKLRSLSKAQRGPLRSNSFNARPRRTITVRPLGSYKMPFTA
jgi:hypothetical protein